MKRTEGRAAVKLVAGLTVGLVLLAIVVLAFGRVDHSPEPPDPETACRAAKSECLRPLDYPRRAARSVALHA